MVLKNDDDGDYDRPWWWNADSTPGMRRRFSQGGRSSIGRPD